MQMPWLTLVEISTFTHLYSLTRSGMVTNLKDDSCDLLLLYHKNENTILKPVINESISHHLNDADYL